MCHARHQFAVTAEAAFDLKHQRHAAIDAGAKIAQRHHSVRRILERDGLQFVSGFGE